ncbi:MAG: hypothetical protein ACMZ66_05395 [Thalassospira sp.]|uniref:hypothetical protein n=1 Tax=Thalassospira sp. TaxID=1912094 RepID=UPI003A86855B
MSIRGTDGQGWGGSDYGPSRSDRGQGDGGANQMSKQQFDRLFGGGGGGGNAPSRGGNGGGNNNQAPQAQAAPNRSLGAMRAELDRRDRAAVAALGGLTGGVNQASDVFNDDEEGINSIGEALGRFGSWVQDQFGVNNPRGFLGSNAASLGAGALGFLAAGPFGASVGATATKVAADPKPARNAIGYVANALGGMPGVGGLVASGVGLLDDNVVDLDKVVATGPTSTNTAGSMFSPAGNRATLGNQYPGGRQTNDNPVLLPATNTALSTSRTGTTTTPKPNPNTIRRTFSPLNISYARLRGIEELL